MVVYQCTHFSNKPKLSYEKAVKWIVKYLIRTKYIGIEAKIDLALGLIAYADSDFANRWNKLNPDDISSLFLRTGYIIYFMGMIIWCSQLQSHIALSSIEAEYISLSMCLRDIISIMNLI